MAWYWEIAILLYFGAGMWIGGFWMNDDGENFFHFLFSLVIALFWPLVIVIVVLNDASDFWWLPLKRFFSRLNFVRRIKERIERKREQTELENNYEDDRCERMGLNDEDVWKT